MIKEYRHLFVHLGMSLCRWGCIISFTD